MARSQCFVSYSHTDMAPVRAVVNALRSAGLSVWFDENGSAIYAGEEWAAFIDQRIREADQCIIFFSRISVNRAQVIRELELMLALNKRIIPVCLERVPLSKVKSTEVRTFMEQIQSIHLRSYGRHVTRAFLQALLDRLGGPAVLQSAQPLAEAEEIGYLYEDGLPVRQEYAGPEGPCVLYQLTRGDISPTTVFPRAMDNQYFSDRALRQDGLFQDPQHADPAERRARLAEQKARTQRQELMRSLLHYPQVLLNRAFFLNSPALRHCYCREDPAYDAGEERALGRLMDSGALLIYLMREPDPTRAPAFDVPEAVIRQWSAFCQRHTPFCLKLDWNEEANGREARRKMEIPFFEFCVNLCNDSYRADWLAQVMGIPEERWPAFRRRLEDVRLTALANGVGYSRNQFYQHFVTAPGTDVSDSFLDPRKPFAVELKKVIDLKYNCNFADACGCLLHEPPDALRRPDLLEDQTGAGGHRRELDFDELSFAISELGAQVERERAFLPAASRLPRAECLTFSAVQRLRASRVSWSDYSGKITEIARRANEWDVDFGAILDALGYFREVLGDLAALAAEEGQTMDSVELPEAVSILFQVDQCQLAAVYRRDGSRLLRVSGRGNQASLSPISIRFQYGDRTLEALEETVSSEFLFFQGMTSTGGRVFLDRLTAYLKDEEHFIEVNT